MASGQATGQQHQHDDLEEMWMTAGRGIQEIDPGEFSEETTFVCDCAIVFFADLVVYDALTSDNKPRRTGKFKRCHSLGSRRS